MEDRVKTGVLAIVLIIFAVIAKINLEKGIDWIAGIILVLGVAVGWYARGAKLEGKK